MDERHLNSIATGLVEKLFSRGAEVELKKSLQNNTLVGLFRAMPYREGISMPQCLRSQLR